MPGAAILFPPHRNVYALICQLARLTDPALREAERYVSFRDGGGGIVLREDVVITHASVEELDGGLAINATADGAIVEATCRGLDLPEDWRPLGHCAPALKPKANESMWNAQSSVPVTVSCNRRGLKPAAPMNSHGPSLLAAGPSPSAQPASNCKFAGAIPTQPKASGSASGTWPDGEGNAPVECLWTGSNWSNVQKVIQWLWSMALANA